MVVRGLDGAENGGARWAAELGERVGDGWQRGRTQLMLLLQAPAGGDTLIGVTVPAKHMY